METHEELQQEASLLVLFTDNKFKCQTYANQHKYIAEDCAGIGLNGQSFEIVQKFCYLGETRGAKGGAIQCYNKDQEWME